MSSAQDMVDQRVKLIAEYRSRLGMSGAEWSQELARAAESDPRWPRGKPTFPDPPAPFVSKHEARARVQYADSITRRLAPG